jgi:hypothetical protein
METKYAAQGYPLSDTTILGSLCGGSALIPPPRVSSSRRPSAEAPKHVSSSEEALSGTGFLRRCELGGPRPEMFKKMAQGVIGTLGVQVVVETVQARHLAGGDHRWPAMESSVHGCLGARSVGEKIAERSEGIPLTSPYLGEVGWF